MKLNNLKKTMMITAFALVALLGVSESADAQTRRQVQRQQQQVERQQQRVIQQQQRIIRQQQQQQRVIQQQQNNRYRVYRNGSYYQTDQRGAELLRQAVNRGYQQGVRAGQADRMNRRSSNYRVSPMYRSGNYGYQSYVDARQYQYYFQQGFERGYQDGYNSRFQYGSNNNGAFNILGTILQGILNIQRF